jgi:radical SAM-linked protein
MLEHLIRDLEKEGLIEEAWSRFRRAPQATQATWKPWRRRLDIRAGVARARRQQREQVDADRCLLRIRYARGVALKDTLPPAFHALVLAWLREAGLRIAMSLERTPKPLLAFGPSLPLGAVSRDEYLDATLNAAPPVDWLESANHRAPEGLRLLDAALLPPYAQTAMELARAAVWFWPCPAEPRGEAEARIAAFLAADRFEIEKGGKVDGRKTVKRVDVRGLVAAAAWEAGGLAFTTRLEHGEAMNPAKLLAGITGLEATTLAGLERRCLELADDPRLKQQDRYAPKLKNIFEDAVLLGAGGNIILVDEDDEEPLVLGS